MFEAASVSNLDIERTKQYQIEAQRSLRQKSYTNEDEFLQSLNMVSIVEPFTKFNTPRVAQLSQRSNQFNLRTVRYTEADIESFSVSEDFFTFTFGLEDKFGDNGLICIIILKKENEHNLFIDTWLMSCRVLKRGMEHFALNQIINKAREYNFKTITGEYIPTPKNYLVKDHYKNLGFTKKDTLWILNVDNYELKKPHIQIKP